MSYHHWLVQAQHSKQFIHSFILIQILHLFHSTDLLYSLLYYSSASVVNTLWNHLDFYLIDPSRITRRFMCQAMSEWYFSIASFLLFLLHSLLPSISILSSNDDKALICYSHSHLISIVDERTWVVFYFLSIVPAQLLCSIAVDAVLLVAINIHPKHAIFDAWYKVQIETLLW